MKGFGFWGVGFFLITVQPVGLKGITKKLVSLEDIII